LRLYRKNIKEFERFVLRYKKIKKIQIVFNENVNIVLLHTCNCLQASAIAVLCPSSQRRFLRSATTLSFNLPGYNEYKFFKPI